MTGNPSQSGTLGQDEDPPSDSQPAADATSTAILAHAESGGGGEGRGLTKTAKRLVEAGAAIRQDSPDRADFLHTVMCQVGLPRRYTPERTFERHNGHMSVLLEAGRVYDGTTWVDMPLPYGTTPRLVMVHISTEAVRKQTRNIEIGDSMRHFLGMLGMQTGGGPRGGYTTLRKQMVSLAACHLKIGMQDEGRVVTVKADPIDRFEAWHSQDSTQTSLWPGVLQLSHDFYNTLNNHAVPLDHRALAALRHSALALDIYTWLAHRLRRVSNSGGVKLSWANLHEQFGQEYASVKDFKKEFRHAMRQVLPVYPDARVSDVDGGITLYPSLPPVHQTFVSFALPTSGEGSK